MVIEYAAFSSTEISVKKKNEIIYARVRSYWRT